MAAGWIIARILVGGSLLMIWVIFFHVFFVENPISAMVSDYRLILFSVVFFVLGLIIPYGMAKLDMKDGYRSDFDSDFNQAKRALMVWSFVTWWGIVLSFGVVGLTDWESGGWLFCLLWLIACIVAITMADHHLPTLEFATGRWREGWEKTPIGARQKIQRLHDERMAKLENESGMWEVYAADNELDRGIYTRKQNKEMKTRAWQLLEENGFDAAKEVAQHRARVAQWETIRKNSMN